MPIADALAFGFTEHMAGTYTPRTAALPGGAFHFTFEVDCRDIGAKATTGRAVGTLVMAGLAENLPAEGTLELSPFFKRRIRYTFDFTGNDGARYRFDGHKTIRWLRALSSWTTLPGTVVNLDTGETVADVRTTFDLTRDLGQLVTSFRRARA
jgi:hypothetical protein